MPQKRHQTSAINKEPSVSEVNLNKILLEPLKIHFQVSARVDTHGIDLTRRRAKKQVHGKAVRGALVPEFGGLVTSHGVELGLLEKVAGL